MDNSNKHTSYIRFLKDEKFIEWKLFSTDELDNEWKLYLEKHPEEREDFLLAERHFNNIELSAFRISGDKKEEAAIKLIEAVDNYNRRRKIRRYYGYAAAVVILLTSTLFYFQKSNFGKSLETAESFIVGSELQSEDIQLITSNETMLFHENIEISITGEGRAQVKKEKETQAHKHIEMDKNVFSKLIVPYGKRSTLTLADGSKLWLNSGSVLEFPARFEKDIREITLASGELYIEVAPDKKRPFFVITPDIKVEVTGTKFNVTNYAGSPKSVVLVEGEVSVQAGKQSKHRLLPSEQAVLTGDDTFETRTVDVNRFVSWRNGYLLFEEASMLEVLRKIERYYNISFNYDKDLSLKELTCSGRIVLSENIDNVMTTIALLTSTKYNKIDNNIYISYKTE